MDNINGQDFRSDITKNADNEQRYQEQQTNTSHNQYQQADRSNRQYQQTQNQQQYQQYQQPPVSDEKPLGYGNAVTSMVLGIVACAFTLFAATIVTGVVAIAISIIGLVLASKAKAKGFLGGIRTAGFVLSLIGLVLNAVLLVACATFLTGIGICASSGLFDELLNELKSLQ